MFSRTEPYKYDGNIQGLFDLVYNHVVSQGKPAFEDGIGCQYRTADGLACAVGCLFTDEQCEKGGSEGTKLCGSTHSYAVQQHLGRIGVFLGSREHQLLCRLQLAHDTDVSKPHGVWLDSFKTKASEIAKEFGLTVPQPAKPKRVAKPGTKRYWANRIRQAAKDFESGKLTWITGDMGSNETCCAVGALAYQDGKMRPCDRWDWLSDPLTGKCTLPSYINDACRAVCPDTSSAYNNVIIDVNDTSEDVKDIVSKLRRIAYAIEHGGKVSTGKKAEK